MSTMTVTTDLTGETRDALLDMAEAEGISRAKLIRRILEEATETGDFKCLTTQESS